MNHQWFIPDMFWPQGPDTTDYVSHEAICVLNTGDSDAQVDITLYYEDAEPVGLETVVCGGRRTLHIRMDRMRTVKGEGIRRGVPYAAMVESAAALAVQYSRLDTTPGCTLMTAML